MLLLALGPLLAGCTALRLGYSNGPQLAWWWLDNWMDFSREQSPPVKQAIDRWFAWHRSTQLPGYARLLAQMQPLALQPLTPDLVCQWQDRLQAALAPATERALQEAADILPLLGEAQISHLAQRQAERNQELREEHLQPDPAERLQASTQRTVERMERLYGRLSEPQRVLVRESLATNVFDAERWLAERQRNQEENLRTLRRLAADKADRATRVAALQALAQRGEVSADPAYRNYQQQLKVHNCRFIAQLHNSTTAQQRRTARERLQGWENDLRTLMAGDAVGVPDPSVAQ